MKSVFELPRQMRSLGSSGFRGMARYVSFHISRQGAFAWTCWLPRRDLAVKGMPAATGTQPATLAQVMTGEIDVGWGAPPFGLKELSGGQIIVANGNDVPA